MKVMDKKREHMYEQQQLGNLLGTNEEGNMKRNKFRSFKFNGNIHEI
jgi:hypothetical protein